MSNRHSARTIALQTLFQFDTAESPLKEKIQDVVEYTRKEFAPKFKDGGFIDELVFGVIENRPALDELIVRFAPDWPLESMTTVDRNVLRIGAFEMKFSQTVPCKVAIDESIELAKAFGGEASGRFVNGVLGAVYKEMVDKGELKEIDKTMPAPKVAPSDAPAPQPGVLSQMAEATDDPVFEAEKIED